jgi:hypothetical protein
VAQQAVVGTPFALLANKSSIAKKKGGEIQMVKKVSAVLVALLLVPTLALAAVMEGTVVKKGKNEIVVQTEKGERHTLQIASNTKGLENAREGAKIKIAYSKKGNQLVASEISSSGGDASEKSAPKGKSLLAPR